MGVHRWCAKDIYSVLASPPGWRSSPVSDESRSVMGGASKADVTDLTSDPEGDDTAGISSRLCVIYAVPPVQVEQVLQVLPQTTARALIKGRTLKPASAQRSPGPILVSDFDRNTTEIVFRGSNAAPKSSRRTEKAEEVSMMKQGQIQRPKRKEQTIDAAKA